MEILDVIRNFLKQFDFEPNIVNYQEHKEYNKFLICGMGGSHLAGDFIKFILPELDIVIHKDYGLPKLKDLNERLVITISYSGNTYETISSFEEAYYKNLNIIAISKNGKLLELAKEKNIPFIKLPEESLLPRFAIGYMLKSLFKILKYEYLNLNSEFLQKEINIKEIEKKAQNLVEEIGSKILLIYTTEEFYPLAYYWKIMINENAKTPAFINVIPELCHNEIEIFENEKFSKNFFVIFLNNPENISQHYKNTMDIIIEILNNIKVKNEIINLTGKNRLLISLKDIILAGFVSCYLAVARGVDIEKNNLIELIKERLKNN